MRLKNFFFLTLFVAASCTAADKFEANTYFYEPEAQQALRHELDKATVPYRVDQKGIIWYRIQDTEKVMAARKKIIDEVLVNKHATSFVDQDEEQLFTDALKKNGIKYHIKEQGGRRWVTWSSEDDMKVKKIEDEIDALMSKKLIEQRQRARKNKQN